MRQNQEDAQEEWNIMDIERNDYRDHEQRVILLARAGSGNGGRENTLRQ
jgi:hypothetical protein